MKHTLVVLSLVALVSCIYGQSPEEKARTVAYLQKLQTSEGGFLSGISKDDKDAKPSLRATSSALRGLRYFGGKATDADSCRKYVANCFDKESGGFGDQPGGKPDVATTAIGLMAVVELKMPVNDYRDAAVKFLSEKAKTFEEIRIAAAGLEVVEQRPKVADAWLEQVAKMSNPDGTFGKDDGQARDTGGAVVILLRLGAKLDQQEKVLKVVKVGQRKDGAFGKAGSEGSDLESSYRIMRLFHMLKEKPSDSAALKRFIAKCRNADDGYGPTPGQPSNASATYFAAIILSWLDE